tara:strand:+ start:37 stop:744 length:708 start_codon:yes stop_codon:yes gene_type:complete
MEQIVMNLAIQYAKSRGLNAITDKAIDYAYETLGIENNEDYTGGGIYGMRNAFSPANLGRNALSSFANKAISGKLGGLLGSLGPLGLVAGVAFLGNKYRKQLTGYNTQAEYESARATRNANNRLSKITDRILSGKKYGNYATAIVNSGAGGVQGTKGGPVSHAAEGFVSQAEIDAYNATPVNRDYGNNNGNSGDHDGGASADAQSDDAAGAGGYNKGGIAGINRNRGQLGEKLRG